MGDSLQTKISERRTAASDRMMKLSDRERNHFVAYLAGWVGATNDPDVIQMVEKALHYIDGFDTGFVKHDGPDEVLRSVGLKEGTNR